jgi:hypothetical protein
MSIVKKLVVITSMHRHAFILIEDDLIKPGLCVNMDTRAQSFEEYVTS